MALAVIVFDDNKIKFVPPDLAERIWWCHEGGRRPRTRAQAAYIAHIKRIYLNRNTAPPEYLERHSIERSHQDQNNSQQRLWWGSEYENY